MKTQFDTEKEAQEELELAGLEGLGYSPAINAYCQKDCACYKKGDIHEPAPASQKKYWMIHYPYCINPLVCGVITVEQ